MYNIRKRELIKDRLLISIIIISLLGIVLSTLDKTSDNIVPVFNEYDSNKTYIVNVEGEGINTKNINSLDTTEIIAIYPNISKRYEGIIESGWYNIDKTISFNKNINNINRYYKNIFDNNKLNEQTLDIDINGLGISKIKVVTDNTNKYNKYKIEKVNF